ncbi:MAG: hypothetical protein B6I18_01110 [Bacteroidetes bacterium 4572_112]|nr:MAG: hypothetical protein B6I18_01110 [Bacteroidetes bacterium 4572_112]
MEIDKDFKEALKQMPSKEKDKLVLRLLRKDYILAQKLHFELMAQESIEDKRNLVEDKLINEFKRVDFTKYHPTYIMMILRYMSGDINHHVRVTKDKYGEISLNLLMIKSTLQKEITLDTINDSERVYKFCVYIIARMFKIIVMIKSLHEDLQFDFIDDLHDIGQLIGRNPALMKVAIYNTFDVNWIIKNEIPENVKEIHKEIKKMGLLK